MTIEILFTLIGGLGLFFLGMRTMSDALRKVAGDSFKKTLEIITKRPIFGLLIGTFVTALIQSSSATTVMTVGFVNAGLLTLRQAISIVLGANIGTTLTAWLVSFLAVFKITRYALPAIGIGFFLTILGKRQKIRRWGQLLLGFGLLFVGLGFIKDAFGPLQERAVLREFIVRYGSYPGLGILIGMLVTIVLQSSSATIALLQIMAFSGLIDFHIAIPIILGENIGTTITAELAALGTNLNARRTARSHALLNIFGVSYMAVPVYLGWYARLIETLIPGPVTHGNIMFHIALAHTVFNVINSAFVFLPLVGLLEKAATRLTRSRKDSLELAPIYLEKHLLDTPPLAIQQSIKELIRMAGIAKDALISAIGCFFDYDAAMEARVRQQEDTVDLLQKEITQYLIEISERNLDEAEAEEIPVLVHSVNDVERIGDHAENIIELAIRKQDQKLEIGTTALEELKQIADHTNGMFDYVLQTLREQSDQAARRVLEREEQLNSMQVQLKENHVIRLQNQECPILSGLVFVSFVDNLEKIGDHITNIAQASLRHLRWSREFELEK
ncbi:MAG: Na/Pi cotransporter family protein [Spirochaetaceae bacterium]|nr:MAG: Na/Pi cotransporter family protein [Spirochaetaceae bacterium]